MKRLLVAIVASLLVATVNAANVVGQRYIDQLSKGGNISIKQAAQSIYNTGLTDPEVLDVAAEVLLERYPNANDQDMDTLAWVAKALGNSRNPRYYNTLEQVANSDAHAKLRKYAKKSMKQLGSASGEQYTKGMVSLVALREGKAQAQPATTTATSAKTASGNAGLDVIVVGMMMQDVYDLVGQPTATSSYQTGKAWNPFNYGAKDLARTLLLYKGKGRVIVSQDGYSANAKVVEVIIDPNENGYP